MPAASSCVPIPTDRSNVSEMAGGRKAHPRPDRHGAILGRGGADGSHGRRNSAGKTGRARHCDGQLVDPEKLDSDPFIRQVVADAEATKETVSRPVSGNLNGRRCNRHPSGKQQLLGGVPGERVSTCPARSTVVPDTLVYTVSQHDDGEGFTIRSGQREEDDIWKKMPQPELEKTGRLFWPGRWSLTTGANPLNMQPMQMPSKWWFWITAGQKI